MGGSSERWEWDGVGWAAVARDGSALKLPLDTPGDRSLSQAIHSTRWEHAYTWHCDEMRAVAWRASDQMHGRRPPRICILCAHGTMLQQFARSFCSGARARAHPACAYTPLHGLAVRPAARARPPLKVCSLADLHNRQFARPQTRQFTKCRLRATGYQLLASCWSLATSY